MSSYSLCPECKQQVAIPEGADLEARVRCPLCDAEFPLGDVMTDRVEGPPTLVLLTPPSSGIVAEPSHAEPVHLDPETEAEIARLDAAAAELAEEASTIQSQAEGLQVTANTSEPEPLALVAAVEALQTEADGLAAKVDAMPDPVDAPLGSAARPAAAANAYRAAGAALVATADALDAAADLLQARSGVTSSEVAAAAVPPALPEPESSVEEQTPAVEEETPLGELEAELAEAMELGEKPADGEVPIEDQTVEVESPEINHDAEAPLPEPEPESESSALESSIAEATAEPVASETPVAAETPVGPDAADAAILSEGEQWLRKAVLLRSKAEVLRTQGEALVYKADSLAGEPEGEEAGHEAAWHGDWSLAGASAAAGAGVAVDREPIKITPRRQRKPKSVLRELIGVVLGGVTGLAIAYYILNLIGTQYDYLHIWLPGISHTAKYQPAWLPHWLKSKVPPEEADESSTPPKAVPSAKGSGAKKAAKGAPSNKSDQPGKAAKSANPAPAQAAATKVVDNAPAPGLQDALPELPKSNDPPRTDDSELPEPETPTTLQPDDMKAPPAQPETSPPKSETPPADDAAQFGKTVDLKAPPEFGSSDVAGALTRAKDAAEAEMKPEVYAAFCRLGEMVSFIEPKKGVTEWPAQKAAIQKLIEYVGQKDKNANIRPIAKLTHEWLDNPEREYPGVLLAGKIREAGQTPNGLSIAKIALAKPNKEDKTERILKVVSSDPLDVKTDDRVLVLGSLTVGGGNGHRELVVWKGMVVKFPTTTAEPPK